MCYSRAKWSRRLLAPDYLRGGCGGAEGPASPGAPHDPPHPRRCQRSFLLHEVFSGNNQTQIPISTM